MHVEASQQRYLYVVTTALAVLIGALDAATGVDLSLQLLYLGPCWLLAWKVGRRPALVMSIFCSAAWLGADTFDGHTYSHPVFAVSNTLTLFAFLAASSALLSELAATLSRETRNARVDHLTQLCNARAFYELGERELANATRRGASVAVAYLDLDNFKQVNDTLGHLRADDLLRLVARSLKAATRKGDIVGRLGGDEFAVILPNTSTPEAERVLRRALTSVSASTREAGFTVSFSLGCVAVAGSSMPSFETLLKAADRRMYDAKAAGKAGLVLMELPDQRH